MKRKIELLAPAGTMDSLKAAVAAGCDAVYLGSTLFSARAFAGNFTHEQFIEAVDYCHERGVRVYVTMNTLLFEEEIDNAVKEAGFLYEHDVDALLIQDLGLFHRLRIEYPDLELHCSTQMHVHNAAGCALMKRMGASRAVLARETPIEVVKDCIKTGIEIELFAYGALCISYSGQCLMSSSVKNRSGNRGMCAQMCRLRYYPGEHLHTHRCSSGDFVLSPKDLNVVDRIGELIEAGVASLKIEGRMKRPEYVWEITHTFREAIDAYYRGEKYILSPQQQRNLLLMFNRGFTEGHLFHASLDDRMSQFRPNHQGVRIGTVEKYEKGRVLVKLSAPLYQHDGLRILNDPIDTGLTAVRIYKNDLLVNQAQAGERVWLDCPSRPAPRKGQPLLKTSDAKLLEEVDRSMEQLSRRIPIQVRVIAQASCPLLLIATDEEGHSVQAESSTDLETAKNAPLSEEKIIAALSKSKDTPYDLEFTEVVVGNVFLPVSVLNAARRDLLAKMSDARRIRHSRLGHQPYVFTVNKPEERTEKLFVQGINLEKEGVFCMDEAHVTPVVDEQEQPSSRSYDNMVLSQIGTLDQNLHHCIGGMNLNCANSYSMAFLLSIPGVNGVILSSECSALSCTHAIKAFEDRYGFEPYTVRLIYGRRSVMYIKDRFMHEDASILKDMEGRIFPIRYGAVTEILEPTVYTAEAGESKGLIIFTDEDAESVNKIVEENL